MILRCICKKLNIITVGYCHIGEEYNLNIENAGGIIRANIDDKNAYYGSLEDFLGDWEF